MCIRRPRLRPPSWLRLPRATARLRLTALYGGLFLVCGATLLGITYLLVAKASMKPDNQIPVPGAGPNLQQPHQLQAE